MNQRKLGTQYEEAAAEWLTRKGYRLLERNYRCKIGEIDLIARDGRTLVFVEVKYRSNRYAGYPEEALTPYKMNRICRTADFYRLVHKISDTVPCRFDVIAFENGMIRHHENAFSYSY